jgi:hypothetical protein
VAATAGGDAVLAGGTYSPNLPLVNASQGFPGDTNGSNAFLLKLDPSGAFVFSTYLGGTAGDYAFGVSVNRAGIIAVAGGTSSQDFPGIDGLVSGPTEGFVTLFSPAGSRLHGALLPVSITPVAVDDLGTVYVAADTFRQNWPTTPGSFQPTPSQALCIDDSIAPCRQGVLASISADLRSLVYPRTSTRRANRGRVPTSVCKRSRSMLQAPHISLERAMPPSPRRPASCRSSAWARVHS